MPNNKAQTPVLNQSEKELAEAWLQQQKQAALILAELKTAKLNQEQNQKDSRALSAVYLFFAGSLCFIGFGMVSFGIYWRTEDGAAKNSLPAIIGGAVLAAIGACLLCFRSRGSTHTQDLLLNKAQQFLVTHFPSQQIMIDKKAYSLTPITTFEIGVENFEAIVKRYKAGIKNLYDYSQSKEGAQFFSTQNKPIAASDNGEDIELQEICAM